MKPRRFSISRIAILAVALVMVIGLTVTLTGQNAPSPKMALIDDWTHHHLVFSNPGSFLDAVKNGTLERWYKITSDPRYQLQQLKRSALQRQLANAPDFASRMTIVNAGNAAAEAALRRPTPPPPPERNPIKKDWSMTMGASGTASLTGVVGTLNSTNISGSSTLTVDGVVFDASPPTAASQTGSFTGNPTNGQTVTVGGSEVLTASLSTAATGSITVGSSFCFANGQGVTINGTSLTTNATQGTGSVTISSTPNNNDTVTIGSGGTYTFVTSSSPGANQVHISGTSTTATNLADAINGTCGGTDCGTSTTSNSLVSAGTPSSGTVPLTARCADNASVSISDTGSSRISESSVSTGGAGSNASTTFALNNSGSSPASQTRTAANIITAVNTNTTTSAIVTASSGGTGIVSLVADTWGTVGNYTLAESAASGVSVSGSSLSGGTDGTNTGTSFAIDNVNADAADNLAAAITRNGGTVGVTASANGATVTVTASTPGTGANGVTLAETLSNFSWSGNLVGGTNGTTSGTSSPPTFAYWSSNNYAQPSAVATNIATAVNANATTSGVLTDTANSPSSGDVKFTANTPGAAGNVSVTPSNFSAFTGGQLTGGGAAVQPNAYPAKFSFSTTTASCSDFIVYPTGQGGGSSAANIIAYDNLYKASSGGCTTANPSVYWAYNTGTGYSVTTSPVLSWDATGSQVAFIQSNGTTAELVLLKWKASSGTSITSPSTTLTDDTGNAGSYRTCTSDCKFTLSLGANDTYSAPFYDLGSDSIYVGDDSGNLHKITGVFLGSTISEASGWPVTLTSGTKVSTPVYDSTHGWVEVGDFGGSFYFVTASSGAVTEECAGSITTTCPSYTFGDVIADAPMVDGSKMLALAFVTTGSSSFGNGNNSVVEFDTGYGLPTYTTSYVSVGTGGTGYYLYSGAFDNIYLETTNPSVSGAGGNIYVIGNTGGTTTSGATLYQITMTGNSINTQEWIASVSPVVTGLSYTGSGATHPWPSPLTEFCNAGSNACAITTGAPCGTGVTCTSTGTDYIFFSVNRGAKTGCTTTAGNGCIMSYNVSNPGSISQSSSGLNITTPGTSGCWATGGTVIDTSSTTLSGTSQIYFVNLNGSVAGGPNGATSTNCTPAGVAINAVQASQSNP